jgi:hypothetical protein
MKIGPKQIPIEAAIAATREGLPSDVVREIVSAVLSAWPGVSITTRIQADFKNGNQWILPVPILSLPLTKEGQQLDAKIEKLWRDAITPALQENR